MKTVGLIGGVTWHSTLNYYQNINEQVNQRLGGLHSAKCFIHSIDFQPMDDLQVNNDWDTIATWLSSIAKKLEQAGSEGIAICANTLHKVAAHIESVVSIPVIHIADAVGKGIKQQGLDTVGLLGTRFTMKEPFYKNRLWEKFQVQVITPNEEDMHVVDEVIFKELSIGSITPSSKENYLRIIKDLEQKGAQGVILGCTEIPLLIKPEDTPVRLFNPNILHAEAIVDFMLSKTE